MAKKKVPKNRLVETVDILITNLVDDVLEVTFTWKSSDVDIDAFIVAFDNLHKGRKKVIAAQASIINHFITVYNLPLYTKGAVVLQHIRSAEILCQK